MRQLLILAIATLTVCIGHAQVGIGTDNPDASSALDIASTNRGVLIPRLTQAQRDLIAGPAEGLLVYQIDNTPGFYYYDGATWLSFMSADIWNLSGNAGTNATTNFIGTTNNEDLVLRTNGIEAVRISTDNKVGIGTTATSSKVELGTAPADASTSSGTIFYSNDFSSGNLTSPNVTTSGTENFFISGGASNPGWVVQNTYFNSPGFALKSVIGDDINSGEVAGFPSTFSNNDATLREIRIPANGPDAELSFNFRTFINADGEAITYQNRFEVQVRAVNGGGPGIIFDEQLITTTEGYANVKITLPSGTVLNRFQVRFRHNEETTGFGIPFLVVVDDILVEFPGVPVTAPTVTPLIRISDGSEATGNVLKSDNQGNALWSNPTTGAILDEDFFFLSGNTNTDPLYRGSRSNYLLNNAPISARIGSVNDNVFSALPKGLIHVQNENDSDANAVGLGSNEYYMDGDREFLWSHDVAPLVDNTISNGTSANRWLEVWAVNGVINTSDSREKTNIKPLAYGMDDLLHIDPISYTWKQKKYGSAIMPRELLNQRKLGFSAQNLRAVIPEVVVDSHWEKSPKTKTFILQKNKFAGVSYSELLPLVVKGIKENNTLLDQIKKEQKEIEELLNNLD